MKRIRLTILYFTIAVLIASCFVILRFSRNDPPPLPTKVETEPRDSPADRSHDADMDGPTLEPAVPATVADEAVSATDREPLSDREAAKLGLAAIFNRQLEPKEGWHKVERDGDLVRVSIPRPEIIDGEFSYDGQKYVHLWVDPRTRTVVNPPGLPQPPMDEEEILEMMKADSYHERMFALHPVGPVKIVPGLAFVTFLNSGPLPEAEPDEIVLDATPVFAEELFDTRTGTTVIIVRRCQ